jgi:hypothetical protein
MKVMFYGPTPKTPRKVIETIDVDFFDDTLTGIDSNAPLYLETQRVEAQQPPEPLHPINLDSDYYVVTDVLNQHSPDSDFVDPHEVPHPYK